MKNFTNSKMYKSIVIAFVIVATVFANGYGQTVWIDSYSTNPWWTGRVSSNFNKDDDELWIGDPTFGAPRRSWIVFDINAIPTNATITSIELRVYQNNPGGNNHFLIIRDYTAVPPQFYSGGLVWNDIGSGSLYYSGSALANQPNGWKNITLNGTARNNLEANLNTCCMNTVRYWAIGLYENGDNDNNAQLDGYSVWNTSPYCIVSYTVTPCTVSVPPGNTVGPGSGTQPISVTSNGISSWTASENCSWVSISPTTGTGNGTVTATYQTNTSCNSRSCTITFTCDASSDTYTLTQNGAAPTVSVPPSGTVGPGSGNVNIPVTSNGCANWSATEPCNWVTLSPTTGNGNGTVTATYQTNTSCNSRSCIITLTSGTATDTYILTQNGAYPTVSVPSGSTVTSNSGNVNIPVTSNGCATWTAGHNCSTWLSVSPFSGIGNGSVTVTYQQNTSCNSRSCTITFVCGTNSDIYVLTQDGAAPTVSVPPSGTVGPSSGNVNIPVTSNGCANWLASESCSWVTSLSPTTGNGNGTVTVTYQQNTSCSSRSCAIPFTSGPASDSYTLIQDGTGGPTVSTTVNNPLCQATANASGGTPSYSYQWDAAASNQTTQTAINLSTGTFTVTVTDIANCASTATATITNPNCPTGIEEITSITDLIVFPNPNSGEFTIKMELTKPLEMELEMLNIIGQAVYKESLGRVSGSYQKQLDLNGLAKGIYTLQLISEEGTTTRKLMIE